MSELTGPRPDEIEVSLLGPGYGESVVVHMGGGEWMVVDSCTGRDGEPAALDYLDRIGVDPRSAVRMIVATHWHDDHTRGMAGDATFERFLRSVGSLISSQEMSPRRVLPPSPNELSVALWVECGGSIVLLGADLEKSGWTAIVGEQTRPPGRASVFKLPHHGSATADAPEVWSRMLEPEPVAIVAPWSRGGKKLPTPEDVTRILSRAVTAYASADPARSVNRRDKLRVTTPPGTSVRLRSKRGPSGLVRLRRTPRDRSWRVELLGSAIRLSELAA